MCTVTFIPFGSQVFLTSNRDEHPSRQARGLTSFHTPDWSAIHFPIDEASGGSWITLADTGRAVCLLNGAFESFTPQPFYRQSRGQVVMAATAAERTDEFLRTYTLSGIAPFTLLLYEKGKLKQLIWDGAVRYVMDLRSDVPQIWSSVTLYPAAVRAWRKAQFDLWLKHRNTFDRDSIIAFHQMTQGDPHNDFIMNRSNQVKTLSVTSIQLQPGSGSILHLDLDQDSREEILVRYES